MRIIIVSDNHGNQNILKILYHIYSSLYKDNVKFIHLGDSQATNINDLNNFICVKGNNDTLDLPKFQRLTIIACFNTQSILRMHNLSIFICLSI